MLLRNRHQKDKPSELLASSPKGTVPVLVLPQGTIIEQSIQGDDLGTGTERSQDLMRSSNPALNQQVLELIGRNDNEFIGHENTALQCATEMTIASGVDALRRICARTGSKLGNMITCLVTLLKKACRLCSNAVCKPVREVEEISFVQSEYRNVLGRWLGAS